MRPFIFFILAFLSNYAIASEKTAATKILVGKTYYVRSNGGNGDGLSDANAWNLQKLNTTHVLPGSTVLFKKGDIFNGSLKIFPGEANNEITYASYGTGSNPIITGLIALTSWTPTEGGIYYTTVDVPELNVVTVDGKLRNMGRYPKKGYLVFTSHSGTRSISGPSIAALPFEPTGGEAVIRKVRQITDRQIINSYQGNTLTLSAAGAYGTVYLNNNNDAPMDGNGYFIQGHIKTLTEPGDWYYDKSNKRLYVHFGTDSPQNHVVKASGIRVLAQMDNIKYVVIKNLDFEGANRDAINMNNNNHITISDCNFSKSFGAIAGDNGVNNLNIEKGQITDILSSAILIPGTANQITLDGIQMTNIGIIPGAGGSGGGQQLGIWLGGNNLTVRNCILKNIGYHGIGTHGDNTLVEQNLIDTYGLVKDDCGGIYEFQFTNIKSKNKIIRKNTILNGVGEPAGAPAWEQHGQASAIYLDVAVNNVEVYDNVLAHGNWGGIHLIGSGENNRIVNNLVFDFPGAFLIYNYETLKIRNTTVTGNKFIAKTSTQYPLYLQMFSNDNPSLYGIFDNNIYCRPIDDEKPIGINRVYAGGGLTTMSLSDWKSSYKIDLQSPKQTITAEKENDIRFDYNHSNDENLVSLNSVYSDFDSTLYSSKIKLPPFSGSILLKVADIIESVASGSWTDSTVWSTGNVPGPKDFVIINKGHSVSVSQNIAAKNIQINTEGNLLFLGNFRIEN